MQRTIYSCDWCNTDSPQQGCMGEGWRRDVPTPRGPRMLCVSCLTVLDGHIRKAEDDCTPAHPKA